MTRNRTFALPLLCAALLTGGLCLAPPAEATHFRYSHIHWSSVA